MEYAVKSMDEGGFQVVQFQPVTIATCTEEAQAIKIASMLNGQIGTPANTTKTSARQTRLVASEAFSAVPKRLEGDVLNAAFDDIRNGNKIADVAERFGTEMSILRSQWAAEKKREKRITNQQSLATDLVAVPTSDMTVKQPFETAVAAISELRDQVDCQVCGRKFDITPECQDLCARCSGD